MSIVYTPTGLVQHGSLTLPSDGDPAVVASVNAAGFQYLADNTAWSLLQGANVFNVRNYGAAGTGSGNDRPAFLSAMAAAASTGGGIVYAPAGHYLLGGGFAWDASVCLIGDGFDSFLELNHASDSFFNISIGGSSGHPLVRFENLVLGARVSNGGIVFLNNGTSSPVMLRNVVINGGYATNLDGRPIDMSAGTTTWTITNCSITNRSSAETISMGSANQQLILTNSSLYMPASYTAAMVRVVGRAVISGNLFDVSAHSSGLNPTCVNVAGAGTKPVAITGNLFFGAGSGPTKYAMAWTDGAMINSSGNSYYYINRVYPGMGLLADGSEVDLLPETNQFSSSATITIDPGIALQEIVGTNTSNPTLTLPKIFYEGQELVITLFNNSGSNWTGVALSTTDGVDGGVLGGLNTGTCYCITLRAADVKISGTLRWTVVGLSSAFVPH